MSSGSGIGLSFATRPSVIHLFEFLNQREELRRRSNTKSSIVLQEGQPGFRSILILPSALSKASALPGLRAGSPILAIHARHAVPLWNRRARRVL